MNPIYHALAVATVQLGQLDSAGGILGNITGLLKGGIQMLGAIMVVWGGVTIGINVHNGASGNGAAIAAGVGTLIGRRHRLRRSALFRYARHQLGARLSGCCRYLSTRM